MIAQEDTHNKDTHPISELNSTNVKEIKNTMMTASHSDDHLLSDKNISEFIEECNLTESDIFHNINIEEETYSYDVGNYDKT